MKTDKWPICALGIATVLLTGFAWSQVIWVKANRILLTVYTNKSVTIFADVTPFVHMIWIWGMGCLAIGFCIGWVWRDAAKS